MTDELGEFSPVWGGVGRVSAGVGRRGRMAAAWGGGVRRQGREGEGRERKREREGKRVGKEREIFLF